MGNRVVTTYRQKVQIVALLDEHLKPFGETGLYLYNSGWNDKAVAETVGGGLSALHVSTARLALDMRLAKPEDMPGEATGDHALIVEIVRQHNRLAALVAPTDTTLLIEEVTR